MDLNTSAINKTSRFNQAKKSQNTNAVPRPRGKSFLDFGILSQHLDAKNENSDLSDSDDENQY